MAGQHGRIVIDLAQEQRERAIGIVLIMVGLTWFALGSGFLGGSVMSGQVIWAVIGVAVAIGGGFVLYRGIPRR